MARKISTVMGQVAAGLAALSMVAAAGAASADPRGRYDRYHHRSDKSAETALVAGVLGLAIGAAIASSSHDNDRYDRPGRAYGYDYGPPPPPPPPPRYYGRGYSEECWTTRDYDRRSGVVYERTVCR